MNTTYLGDRGSPSGPRLIVSRRGYNERMRRIEELTLDEIEQMAIAGDTTVQQWGWRNIVRELCRRVRSLEQQREQNRNLGV